MIHPLHSEIGCCLAFIVHIGVPQKIMKRRTINGVAAADVVLFMILRQQFHIAILFQFISTAAAGATLHHT